MEVASFAGHDQPEVFVPQHAPHRALIVDRREAHGRQGISRQRAQGGRLIRDLMPYRSEDDPMAEKVTSRLHHALRRRAGARNTPTAARRLGRISDCRGWRADGRTDIVRSCTREWRGGAAPGRLWGFATDGAIRNQVVEVVGLGGARASRNQMISANGRVHSGIRRPIVQSA